MGQSVGLRLGAQRVLSPRVLGPGTLVSSILLGVKVIALPDVPPQVAEDAGVVVVATCAAGRLLSEHATADDATESLMRCVPPEGGAAPKRDALIFSQTI